MAYSKVRYNRTLNGENAEIIVAKARAYTTQATYKDFEANAVDGELGIFDAATMALIAAGAAIPTPAKPNLVANLLGGTLAADEYFYKISYVNATGESVASAEASITTTGTTSSVNIFYPAGPAGTTVRVYRGLTTNLEDAYQVGGATSFTDTGAAGTAGTPLSVATGVVPNVLTTGQKYFIALRRDTDGLTNAKLIKTSTVIEYDAKRTRKVPYVAPVKQVTTISIAAGYTPVKGDDLEIAIIETTPGNEPFPVWDYNSVIGDTGVLTLAQALTKIVARINNPLDLVHKDDGAPATAVLNDTGGGTFTVVITSAFFGEHFRVALRGPLATYGSVVYTTPFVAGSGYSDQVKRLEAQGWIFEGVVTNYPMHGNPEDYGFPTGYTVDGLTYNFYHLDPLRVSKEPMPQNVHHHWAHIYLITPVEVGNSAATSPDKIVSAILGF